MSDGSSDVCSSDLQGVVPDAEVREVSDRGGAAVVVFVIVVELAAVCGGAASESAAVLVAGLEEPLLVDRGGVSVDVEDGAGDRVAHHPIPSRRVTGEPAGGVGVDGDLSVESRSGVGGSGERGDRDGDLHVRADRGQPSRAAVGDRVDRGRAGAAQAGNTKGGDLSQYRK